MSGVADNCHVQEEGLLEQVPHVVGGVDLLHLNLCVDVTVRQKVDISVFHFRDSVFVNNHFDDVIKGKKAVTLDLCIDVLPHRAAGQEPDQFYVVAERTGVIHPVPLTAHHLQEVIEGSLVIVEYEDVFASIDKLLHDQVLTPPYELRLCVDDGLEEPQVLHMLPVALDAVDEVLNHFLVHFIAQHCIVLKDCTHSLRVEQVRV